MKILNAFVFAGLIASGLILFAGYLMDSGTLKAFSAYVGWFLCAYSGIAYLIVSLIFASRGGHGFWATMYPVNFALVLFALSTFGIHDTRTVIFMGAAGIAGAVVSYVAARSRILDRRGTPITILLLLALVFVDSVFMVWKYYVVALGAFVLTSSLLAFVKTRRPDQPLQSYSTNTR